MKYEVRSFIRYCYLAYTYRMAFLAYILSGILKEKRSINPAAKKMEAQKKGSATGWCAGDKEMLLFGKFPIFTLREGEEVSAHHFYFRRPQAPIRWAFMQSGISLPKNPFVFESGCGCGKNLYYFQDTLNATVKGYDIYNPAISVANNANIFSMAQFEHYDAVKNGLSHISDSTFDLVIIHSYLSHIAHFPEFQNHLDELIRIGKNILVFEVVNTDIMKNLEERGFEKIQHPHHMVMMLKGK